MLNRERSVKRAYWHSAEPVRLTYPRVLMKPLVDPSAYREQMSPMCKKLDILSDMFDTHTQAHKGTPAADGGNKNKLCQIK